MWCLEGEEGAGPPKLMVGLRNRSVGKIRQDRGHTFPQFLGVTETLSNIITLCWTGLVLFHWAMTSISDPFPTLDTSSPCLPPLPLPWLIKHGRDFISAAEREVLDEAKTRLVSLFTPDLQRRLCCSLLPIDSTQESIPHPSGVIYNVEGCHREEEDGLVPPCFSTEWCWNTCFVLDWGVWSWGDHSFLRCTPQWHSGSPYCYQKIHQSHVLHHC